MSFPPQAPRSSSPYRAKRGFTLVELIVVITIIGILVGILIPTILGLMNTVGTFSTTNQIEQLNAAISKFKDEMGFYPSDFSEFVDSSGNAYAFTAPIPRLNNMTVEQRLKQFLQRISPTHNEDEADPDVASKTRLENWWDEVGMKIATASSGASRAERLRGPRIALWFWLTQLHNDSQYPFTGTRGPNITSQRNVFVDFGQQLSKVDETDYVWEKNTTGYELYEVIEAGGDGPLTYFHHLTYQVSNSSGAATTSVDFEPGSTIPNISKPCREFLGAGTDFYGARSYQIAAAGNDGFYGDVEFKHFENNDNTYSFSEGRLDAFLDNQQQ